MIIRSFKDLVTINSELASKFLNEEEAVSWIHVIENGIKDWIKKHNKQHWDVVRYVSYNRGILGEQKEDGNIGILTRKDFAEILITFCSNALEQGETVNALKSSMEHYKYADYLAKLCGKKKKNNIKNSTIAVAHIEDVENIFDNKPLIEHNEAETNSTLEELLEKYLRNEIEKQNSNEFPQTKILIKPQYDNVSPAISVETYKSKKFLDEHQPSHIEAYEFIDSVLEINKLNEFIGQYYDKKIKLYIASSYGLLPNVRALAKKHMVGYIRINPNTPISGNNYVLPRSIEDNSKWLYNYKVLTGEEPMTAPILIDDCSILTSSLTDVLSEQGVVVKKHRLLNIPYLLDDEIEKITISITEKDVEDRIQMLKSFRSPTCGLYIDPFKYADSIGLSHKTGEMVDKTQLGLFDVEANQVTLNSIGLNNLNRYRFTMAHELGHHILHSPLLKKQGVVSVGESEKTISISNNEKRQLEYQANKFASYLLMPTKLICELYIFFYNQYVRSIYGGDLHSLYYNPNQRETWSSYQCVVGSISEQLKVSLHALNIRLKSLGLLKMPD